MLKYLILILISVMTFIGFSQTAPKEIPDFCTSTETKKRCKEALSPYGYDASKTTKITFKHKPQLKELEIPLYMGEEYRFVFNVEGLPQDVDINIYDKKYEAKNRKVLWSSKDQAGGDEFIFDPEKSRKMYINYIIPPTDGEIKKGCVVMVLGYKMKKD